MKFCENDYHNRWIFSPSFIRIRQEMWIFYYQPNFECGPFFYPDFRFKSQSCQTKRPLGNFEVSRKSLISTKLLHEYMLYLGSLRFFLHFFSLSLAIGLIALFEENHQGFEVLFKVKYLSKHGDEIWRPLLLQLWWCYQK